MRAASSRNALIEAARDEFSALGYEAATVAGIAERAGVTTGALYAHFNGKLDLLIEAIGLASPSEYVQNLVRTFAMIFLLRDTGLSDRAVAYMGDDLLDLPVLSRVGLSAALADAAAEVIGALASELVSGAVLSDG